MYPNNNRRNPSIPIPHPTHHPMPMAMTQQWNQHRIQQQQQPLPPPHIPILKQPISPQINYKPFPNPHLPVPQLSYLFSTASHGIVKQKLSTKQFHIGATARYPSTSYKTYPLDASVSFHRVNKSASKKAKNKTFADVYNITKLVAVHRFPRYHPYIHLTYFEASPKPGDEPWSSVPSSTILVHKSFLQVLFISNSVVKKPEFTISIKGFRYFFPHYVLSIGEWTFDSISSSGGFLTQALHYIDVATFVKTNPAEPPSFHDIVNYLRLSFLKIFRETVTKSQILPQQQQQRTLLNDPNNDKMKILSSIFSTPTSPIFGQLDQIQKLDERKQKSINFIRQIFEFSVQKYYISAGLRKTENK